MTTRKELVGFIESDPLYVPKVATPFLEQTILATQEYIETSILLFAANRGGEQPDLVAWFDQKNLLSEQGLDTPEGESMMVEDYKTRSAEVEQKVKDLDEQSRSVRDSTFETFKLTNETYTAIRSRYWQLDGELRDINEHTDSEDSDKDGDTKEYLPLTASEEMRAFRYLMLAIEDVNTLVEEASTSTTDLANRINDRQPSFSIPPGAGPAPTRSTPWSQLSTATIDPTGNGTTESVLELARKHLKLGVGETNGNNVPIYWDAEKQKWVKAPYNIGDAWCAAFTSYVWERAGYKVDWTNPNYVPSIWNDARSLGLGDTNTANAQPGDLIIFDWENDGTPDHIGIVESVNGNQITTIEGNSSDKVKQNTYTMGQSSLVGVVKPPQ